MAEEFSSRRPPRDARLDELLAESRALLRGQERLSGELRQTEVRRAREAPQFKADQRRPVEETRPVERAPAQREFTEAQRAMDARTIRTRNDVEADIKRQEAIAARYKNALYDQGRVPSRRSSVVRGHEQELAALRQERAGFAAAESPLPDLQKRVELFRQGKSLTGQQTAAEIEQLGVIKQKVREVQELRAAQRPPAPAVGAPAPRPPRLSAGDASDRLETIYGQRRQAEILQPSSPLVIGAGPYRPARAGSLSDFEELEKRQAAEKRIAAERQAGIAKVAEQEAAIQAQRQTAERQILLDRRLEAETAGSRNARLAADLNAGGIPPRGLRPSEGALASGQPAPRGGVLQFGQPAGDRSGAGPVLRRGFQAPVRGFPGLEGGGVVQNYARSTDQAMGAINAAERAQKSLPAFYRELQRGSVIQAGASQQMRRHGALTTEFLSALARGETTLAEFRFQIGSTIAKFGGWTVAAASVYGVIGAISTLSRGARDSLSGVQQLNRFITNVDTKAAAKGFRDVSREVNVSIGDVGNAQANFLRVYHDQGQALEASRTALKLTKLDNLSAADSLRFLTASAQEFKLPASQIVVLGDKLANVFRTMGVPIQESLPAFARSAAVVRNAGGELTELIELIAIARRQTGQTGNTIGTALSRSAATFVNRPSSQTVFKQLGLDPKQASDDYTKFVLSAIRRARTLSAPEIRELAAAIGGPQFGARIFTGLLRGYRLLPQAAKAAGSESAGTLDKELKVKLAQVDEQISKVGNSLERLGSGLASAGAFAPLGLALKTLNAILDTANDLTGAFASLPGPFKAITVALGEAYLALKLLRRTGLGGGLAERTGLGYLGYSPQEQLRRGTIITQRNLGQGLANEAEQLGNRYQVATSGSVAAAELAVNERKKLIRLGGVANVDQKLLAEADARTIAFEEESRRLGAEAVALKGQIEVNARLQAEADARLLGLQKRQILPSQVAKDQGGAIVVAGPQGPRVVSTEEAKAIEAGNAPLFVKAPPVAPSGAGAAAQGEASAESAKASARAAAAASGLVIPARAAEQMALEAAAAEKLAAVAVNTEAVALEAQAVENVGLGASFARLGRSSIAAGRSAALATRETSYAALARFGALVADPLVLALAAFEVLPAIYHSGTKRIKAAQDRAANLARDPQSRADLEDVLAQARKTAKDVGQVGPPGGPRIGAQSSSDEYHIATTTLAAEQRVAAAQARARAANRPVPLRFVQGIKADFDAAVNQRRQGSISERELQAAYAKAQTELEHSRQATSGTAAGAKVVAAAEKKFGVAILEATNGQKAIAQALKEQSLSQIAQALQDEADQIAIFGAQPGDTKRISAQFAEAVSRVAKDPSAKNLKAYGAARSALDKTLQDAQTQLQQSLAVATTGGQRSAAYSEYFKTIEGESGVEKIRANVLAARSRAANAAQSLEQAKLAPPAAQPQKTFGTTGSAFGAFAGPDAAAQPGAPAQTTAAKKALESQRAGIDELRKNFGKNSTEVRRLTALYKRSKLALDAMEQDARSQEAQSQNQIADLRAQLRAGRAGSATEAIAIQLRAAHEALRNDIKHDVGEEQRLQEKLKIQQLQDQQLQTAIQQIQTKSALATSRIDPVNQGAVDRSNLSGLYKELARARAARPGAARDDQVTQIQTQINSLRFQAAQNIRQQAQSENDAYFAYLEAGLSSINPLRVAQLEYQKTLADLKYAHGKAERLQALASIKQAQQAVADAVRQNAIDENDAYYAYREAGLGTLHPVQVARLEYQKALHGLNFARNKVERLQALAEIKNAQEALAEAVHQNAIDEVNAYFGLAESKTTDPLRLAQLEYQKAVRLQKKARGPKEKQQTAIDKNNALKNLYQTQADERLKTIEFETSIDKITSDQEIGALKNLLKLKHLTKDFRRQLLTQIHQLENQDSSSVELNVGNIRLPTLYDVRRLAAQGTNNQPVIATQTINFTINGANDPQQTAYAVSAVINKQARTHHKAAARAAGIR